MGKTKQIDLSTLTLPATIGLIVDAPSFSGAESLALAGRIAMAKHVQKLYAHLPGVLSGDDPHDIHQMRVATRRLRASLASTAPAYRNGPVVKLYTRLRRLARALGEVRDRDVLLIRLRSDAEQYGADEHSPLHELIARVEGEREEAHAELLDELRRKRTLRLLDELTAFLSDPLGDVQAHDHGLPLLVHHHAGSTIWQHYEQVRRFETAMPHASSERLHDLRIACKHLRYTLELFEPALGEDARPLIKQVTAMQEHLGDLHDADVALAYFGDRQPATEARATHADRQTAAEPDTATQEAVEEGAPTETRDAADSIGAYLAARSAERQVLLDNVGPLWQQLSGDTLRRKLAKVLAAL